jgi:DNA-binding PadR family transcriptional regulator
MESFFDSPRLSELIEQGHLKVVKNEFGENVLELTDTLEEADPEIYELFSDAFMDTMVELEQAGFIATGFDDDGEQYFYATEFGVELFLELIMSRARRMQILGMDQE